VADNDALALRLQDAGQALQKERGRITDLQCDAELPRKRLFHPITLAEPKQRVIDEEAFELLADRAIDERSGNRRIYAP
jgi:hypothetical protein